MLPADLPTQQAGATDTLSPLVTGVVTSRNGGMVEAQFRLGDATGIQTLGIQLVAEGERAGRDPRDLPTQRPRTMTV
ncbi:hypothetical protein [Streptomyces sp. NPDC051636]|uniref:hypothetical protein n=1 Tax=Streptomyces sp. NPDC051636 TaxID=3365663 RepID=UPI0037BB272D